MEPITRFNKQYSFLSNFQYDYIMWQGLLYSSVEAAYQASKTIHKKYRVPFTEMSPGDAKRAGRRIKLRLDWETVKIPIMERLLEKKFSNEDNRRRLLATGDAELIEGNSWGDQFWGVCQGIGENWLGILLMRIREKIRTGELP